MAARGAESKELIIDKILSTFEGSFKNNKEIRIPVFENGDLIQIKVTLTAAKENVDSGEGAVPSGVLNTENKADNTIGQMTSTLREPTEEEKANLEELLKRLDL